MCVGSVGDERCLPTITYEHYWLNFEEAYYGADDLKEELKCELQVKNDGVTKEEVEKIDSTE